MNPPIQPHFTAVFVECEEGGYAVSVEQIPEVHTQGDTLEEARHNLLLALEDYASFLAHRKREER
ncbi:MAG: type II toxin-antitoxin system HicB family antitoxin [Bacteroidota bacterium]